MTALLDELPPQSWTVAEWSARAVEAHESALSLLRLSAGLTIQNALLREALTEAPPAAAGADEVREWREAYDSLKTDYDDLMAQFREGQAAHAARVGDLEGALADARKQLADVEGRLAGQADQEARSSQASIQLARLLDALGTSDVAVALRRIGELRAPAAPPAAAPGMTVCATCKQTFPRPKGPGRFLYCDACKAPKPKAARPPKGLACVDCKHGAKNDAAELGWECRAACAVACQPRLNKLHFEPREDA